MVQRQQCGPGGLGGLGGLAGMAGLRGRVWMDWIDVFFPPRMRVKCLVAHCQTE
jgi:hypothetical protein